MLTTWNRVKLVLSSSVFVAACLLATANQTTVENEVSSSPVVATVRVTEKQKEQIAPEVEVKVLEPVATEEPVELDVDLTEEEWNYVVRVVMAESGNEPFEGQLAVAQCIRNTSEANGTNYYETVIAPLQYASPSTQEPTESVVEACTMVLKEGYNVTDEPIRWFYAPKYVYSEWHESKEYVMTIGGHKFFKE